VHDLAHGVTELLVPFFLAGIGLHLDVGVFSDPSLLGLSALILVAAVVSKLGGCGLGAWSLGRRDAIRVGVGMIPRGEVGLVVAQIGQRMGIIPGHIYGVVVVMAVLTTILAPPLLALAFRDIEPKLEPPEKEPFRLG
jgi:Kef-type K+ transport system membrane component KefB